MRWHTFALYSTLIVDGNLCEAGMNASIREWWLFESILIFNQSFSTS